MEDPKYGVPFLGSTDILAADLSTLSLLSKKQVEEHPELIIGEDWTLITCSGTIGRTAYSRSDMAGMAGSQHFMRVVPNPQKILPGYLYAYLSCKYGVSLVIAGTYGAIIQHIEPMHIADLPIPLLSIDVQTTAHNLINQAKILRSSSLETLYQSGEKLLNIIGLRDLPPKYELSSPYISRQSSKNLRMRFEGAFHSPLALQAEKVLLDANCPIFRLGDNVITRKLFKPSIFKRMWVDSEEFGTPFISGNDIYKMSPNPQRYVSWQSKNFDSYILKRGWVVFQAAGQLNGIFGWPIIANSYIDGMFCADDMFRIVPYSDSDAGYIYAYLRTNFGQRLLKRQAYGYSIPRVVSQHVQEVLIPWPNTKERQIIGEEVFNAWEDLAKAIELEQKAIKIVESTIEGEIDGR